MKMKPLTAIWKVQVLPTKGSSTGGGFCARSAWNSGFPCSLTSETVDSSMEDSWTKVCSSSAAWDSSKWVYMKLCFVYERGGGESPNWTPHCSKQYNKWLFLVGHKEQIQRSIHHPLVSIDVWIFETMKHLVNEDTIKFCALHFHVLSNLILIMFYRMSGMTLQIWNAHTIRPSKNISNPSGRPSVMYALPELYNTRDFLTSADTESV